MDASIRIQPAEYEERLSRLCEHAQAEGLKGCVLFHQPYLLYYTGFAHSSTERPIALAVSSSGKRAFLVPRLELEHAQAQVQPRMDRIDHYVEYPDDAHPMMVLKGRLAEMGITGRIGCDSDGYPALWGYQGPTLSEIMGASTVALSSFVDAQMSVKSQAELALIAESATWGNLAHRLLQRYTKPGVTETKVSMRASYEATVAMFDALGTVYGANGLTIRGAHATYRGQVGRNASNPHCQGANLTFMAGDALVTGANADVWGYLCELERTMFIGKPSDEQRRYFEHILALQEVAWEALKPGATCGEVDSAVRLYYKKHDLTPYWRHHTGHAIGLRGHEAPFLDAGDHTVLKPGMVLTTEPGIYVPGLGGFRHSDTIVITETGMRRFTYYPRDLDSLTIPA